MVLLWIFTENNGPHKNGIHLRFFLITLEMRISINVLMTSSFNRNISIRMLTYFVAIKYFILLSFYLSNLKLSFQKKSYNVFSTFEILIIANSLFLITSSEFVILIRQTISEFSSIQYVQILLCFFNQLRN